MSAPALVILAAGASSRLGECKALVDLAGRSPLERLLAAGAGLDDAPPLVVTGADHEAIAAAAPAAGCELVHNPDWAAGRTGGVAAAVRRRPGLDLCLAPVDVPLAPAGLFERLAAAWEERGRPALGWLAPRRAAPPQRTGHPVVLGREIVARVTRLAPDAPLRDLRSSADPLWSVPFAGPEPWDDLDTAEDLARLRQRLRTGPP